MLPLLLAATWPGLVPSITHAQVEGSGSAVCSGDFCTTSGTNSTPATVGITNTYLWQYYVTGTVSGTLTVANESAAVAYVGRGFTNDGYTATTQAWSQTGPTIALTSSATITSNYAFGQATTGVVYALSTGAAGTSQGEHNLNVSPPAAYTGGTGGTVTITHAGSIAINGTGGIEPNTISMAGILAISQGGVGGAYDTANDCCAGSGGAGGQVSVTTQTGSTIAVNGPWLVARPAIGVEALSLGGDAATVDFIGPGYTAGDGGNAGQVGVTHAGAITNTVGGAGIMAMSIGGAGMTTSGTGTIAGGGGQVTVELNNGSQLGVSGSVVLGNVGVFAASASGKMGETSFQYGGGNVSVTLDAGSAISVSGASAFNIGVLAVSTGSASILDPFGASANISASGTAYSGNVTVANNGSIEVSGAAAVGIAAFSVGGAGIITSSSGGLSFLGNSSNTNGYNAGGAAVSVINNGTIATVGVSGHGILAVSSGGGGIVSTDTGTQTDSSGSWISGVILGASTPAGSPGQNGGAVSVTNNGTIITGNGDAGGLVSMGILAQSIGGGGGSFAGSGVAAFVGDNGGGGGLGGQVTVGNYGQIGTNSDGALGILAQSIGGGGGNGANSAGAFVSVGGQGGAGGNGNLVTVTNAASGAISTVGDFAAGVIAQSIGGGGGNGGFAVEIGLVAGAAIGGVGGNGGNGGTVLASNLGTIAAGGQSSHGLLAQSIGGGGGSGGSANSYVAGGGLTMNLAVGGAGSYGGAGGSVAVDNLNQITTAQADSMGILAQSIGGGGGNGGASTARTVSASVSDIPSFSFTASIGGSGAGGGDGGGVAVRNAASLSTGGDGSHGILVQSVGGGGGNGGDSTAATYAVAKGSPQVNVSIALGASGGSGGTGGAVQFGNGASLPAGWSVNLPLGVSSDFFTACPGCRSTISTAGANASGIVVQSIGGGGGNSTSGNASNNTPLSNYGDTPYKFTLGLGASGGTGATGGTVQVALDANTTIVTSGSGSTGVTAQSIGGGGGTSSGGSFGMAGAGTGTSLPNDTFQANIALGGNGVQGGNAQDVTVTSAARIGTSRGDSIGILAQSIGGGGGLAGSSDAAATVSTTNQIENSFKPAGGVDYEAELSVGGTGGGGGNGGAVTVISSGAIMTAGVRAYGIEAQSIGGGGGNAGSATSNATGTNGETMSANVAIGGTGGVGGYGWTVGVTTSAAIVTGGYNAHGILAQSIGGGGGAGADGSVAATSTMSLGLGASGSSGGSGAGGAVNVTTNSGGTIVTRGDDAAGILAQSIGAGGGTGSFGCGTTCLPGGIAASNYAGTNLEYSFALGNAGGVGNGGAMNVTIGDAIRTMGARAMGIVAQSIGGGGGFAPGGAQTVRQITLQESLAAASSGQAVTVMLSQTGRISTSGAGAWGILAQSIGNGGGFAGDSSLNLTVGANAQSAVESSSVAGLVQVTVNGTIATTGANAHGVVAQSIGGLGGVTGGTGLNTSATLWAGTVSESPGTGGQVVINQGNASRITTQGVGSIGIFAQGTGGNGSSATSVTVSGTVIGGTNSGYNFDNGAIGAAGIVIATFNSGNSIVVNSGGSVSTMDGLSGTAIMTPGSMATIQNSGTITGSINTPNGAVTNNAGGVLNSGATLASAGLTNQGTLNVFGVGTIGTTTAQVGSFFQGTTGNLVFDINPTTGQNDVLTVPGSAPVSINGTITPVPTVMMPGTWLVINAPQGVSASVTLPSSLLFKWSGASVAGGYAVTANANFTPGNMSLTPSQQSLANNLASAWANGDPSYASKFTYLSQVDSPGAYSAMLNALSPKATQAQASTMVVNAGTTLGAALSCPVFVEQSVLLGEDNCAWAKVTGQWTTQSAGGDIQGYQVSGVTYRLGAQHAVAPNWYLGATFGFTQTWASMDGGSTSTGQIFDGSVALKHTMGPWLFAGSVAIASGAFHTNRAVGLPGVGSSAPINATLQSDQTMLLVGGRLRAAYEFAVGDWYMRPYGDVDVIHTHAPGFQESGRTDFALNVYGTSKTTVALSPMVEFGGRIVLGEGLTLRPFLAAGARFLPDNRQYVDASLLGALPGTGSFRTYIELPSVMGSLDVGLQLYRRGGFEARAEYGLKAGNGFLSQNAAGRIAWHF
jgi:hypothetical protein